MGPPPPLPSPSPPPPLPHAAAAALGPSPAPGRARGGEPDDGAASASASAAAAASAANIVLESAFERIIVGGQYCDVPLGVYLVRGENLVMMCRTDLEAGLELPGFRRVSEKEIKEAERAEQAASLIKGTMLKRFDFLDLDL